MHFGLAAPSATSCLTSSRRLLLPTPRYSSPMDVSRTLDYGAEHFKLRHLDMPRYFFGGNNCVAEYGNFPSNFLLGVSTPGNDIQFRRQMRSRLMSQSRWREIRP